MSKEAMKLALEALKQIDEAMPFPVAKFAQAALREALAEQPAQQQEPWGACVSGRVFVGRLPEHARKLSEDEGVPIQWLYTSPQPAQQQEPVYWQWRRKDQPWSLEYTFSSEVQVTTKDSERRALYTSPPAQRKPLPYNKDDMEGLDINQRLGFKLGWKSAEEAHGIKENT